MSINIANPQIRQCEKSADSVFMSEVQSAIGPEPMQLVVPQCRVDGCNDAGDDLEDGLPRFLVVLHGSMRFTGAGG